MISILKISKGNNSAKNEVGVTVVNLCTLSDHGLYLCQVSLNYLERYQSYGADTNVQPLTDGRTDGRTDTQKFGGYNIIPRHFLWRDIKGEYLWQYLMHSALKLISTFSYGKETVYQISTPYVKRFLRYRVRKKS